MDLNYRDLVEVKTPGVRFRQRGHIINEFRRDRLIYAVQFLDNCFGYFDESELEKVPLDEATTDWERGIGFEDITEKASHPKRDLPRNQK
jgi:hypothetical protein